MHANLMKLYTHHKNCIYLNSTDLYAIKSISFTQKVEIPAPLLPTKAGRFPFLFKSSLFLPTSYPACIAALSIPLLYTCIYRDIGQSFRKYLLLCV